MLFLFKSNRNLFILTVIILETKCRVSRVCYKFHFKKSSNLKGNIMEFAV